MRNRPLTLVISTLILTPVLALAGCGSSGGDGGGKTASGTGAVGSDLGSKIGDAVNKASADLAKSYAEQAKQQQTQLDSLKASAKSYGDQQLDTAIQKVQSVLDQLSGKINDIKDADEGSTAALQSEIQKLLGQAGDLFSQAQGRLTQLQKG